MLHNSGRLTDGECEPWSAADRQPQLAIRHPNQLGTVTASHQQPARISTPEPWVLSRPRIRNRVVDDEPFASFGDRAPSIEASDGQKTMGARSGSRFPGRTRWESVTDPRSA